MIGVGTNKTVFKVGLETHLHLDTKEKLFCSCLANKSFCVICKAEPGNMPSRVNSEAILKAALLVNKLNGRLEPSLSFFRKHYYYYDLPAGFQRSQSPEQPFSKGGALRDLSGLVTKISSTYLEEDPASVNGNTIDFFRIGCPLLEVVTEPCFIGPMKTIVKQVSDYLRTLSRLAIDLKICDPHKVMKTDVNVSIEGLNYRYEIKNITSFTDIKNALLAAEKMLTASNSKKEDYTFGYKTSLKESRPKTKYLFLKEYNIPAIDLRSYVCPAKNDYTLYELTELVNNYFVRHDLAHNKVFYYSFLKLLAGLMTKETEKESLLKKVESLEPKLAYKYLKQRDLVREGVTDLESELSRWFESKSFTYKDFTVKSSTYLRELNQLKKLLSQKGIVYNSQLLTQKIETSFSVVPY